MQQGGASAQAAVSIITASMQVTVDEVAERTHAQAQDYADSIVAVLGDLTDLERLVAVAYLGDIARLLNEALAKERGIDPERQIQEIAIRIASAIIEQ